MNERWDAVADAGFWAEAERRLGLRAATGAAAGTSVAVWLFGGLATQAFERPIVLEVQKGGARMRDIVARLGERLGPGFLARVLGPDGRKLRHCRVFVDGQPVDELDAPLGGAQRLEMILLTAAEGG